MADTDTQYFFYLLVPILFTVLFLLYNGIKKNSFTVEHGMQYNNMLLIHACD